MEVVLKCERVLVDPENEGKQPKTRFPVADLPFCLLEASFRGLVGQGKQVPTQAVLMWGQLVREPAGAWVPSHADTVHLGGKLAGPPPNVSSQQCAGLREPRPL